MTTQATPKSSALSLGNGGRVVVGVDSAPASLYAVEWAASEAVALRVPLHIVHTWTWPHLAPWLTENDRKVMQDLENAGEQLLTRCRTIARRLPGLEVTSEVRNGVAADVLTELSREAGLLVVGTHRLRPMGRLVLGSVSSATVARAECPTVVISSAPKGPRPGGVVAGVAASPEDKRVLEFAFEYAHRHDQPLQVLFCWYNGNYPLSRVPIPAQAQAWLAEAVAGWRQQYPDVDVTATVRRVHPVAGLVNAAKNSSLLVVGRRARSHVLPHLGSVSLGVLHHAADAIAVVPS
jgi:nucleotide-binding universal stress UspA family protein